MCAPFSLCVVSSVHVCTVEGGSPKTGPATTGRILGAGRRRGAASASVKTDTSLLSSITGVSQRRGGAAGAEAAGLTGFTSSQVSAMTDVKDTLLSKGVSINTRIH